MMGSTAFSISSLFVNMARPTLSNGLNGIVPSRWKLLAGNSE
jgi:hypothetical protein